MRILVAGILWLSSLAWMTQAQLIQAQNSRPAAQDGGVREVLESIVIPPIANAPFTATLGTEWVKYAADGATITLVNERHIARDGQGRIYEERWALVPKSSSGEISSKLTWIQIADPKLGTLYNCNPGKHICDLLTYDPTEDLAAAAPRRPASGTLTRGSMNLTLEDLGSRNIAGIDTAGVRETRTIAAGAMGNDQPLTSMKEFWHSDQLGINLLSVRTSPMFGKQTFTITEITSAEPDPQMFELPAGYTVNDQRKKPPM
ncbi:MAG: hypothetical protein ACLPY1_18530 [Terracidiphilus sp.]